MTHYCNDYLPKIENILFNCEMKNNEVSFSKEESHLMYINRLTKDEMDLVKSCDKILIERNYRDELGFTTRISINKGHLQSEIKLWSCYDVKKTFITIGFDYEFKEVTIRIPIKKVEILDRKKKV